MSSLSKTLLMQSPTKGSPGREGMARVLQLLGRGVIAFHPRLVKLTGSSTSALMLSQTLYWTRILWQQSLKNPTRPAREREGWFWKTRTDWRRETSLSRHEQDGARARLRQHSFWQEKRTGMPARLWFSVDLDALARTIDADFAGTWAWHDEQSLSRLLGRPLLLYRALADLTGSISTALLLSRMIMDVRMAGRISTGRSNSDGWQDFDSQRLMSSTGLTRAEFYAARKKLRQQGLIRERCTGFPPKWQWQLDLDRIASELQSPDEKAGNSSETRMNTQLAGISISSMGENHILECGKPTFLNAGKPHSRNTDSGQLEISIPANKMDGNSTHSWPESVFPYKGLTTVNTITTKHLPPTPQQAQSANVTTADRFDGGGGVDPEKSPLTTSELVWPTVLLDSEKEAAHRFLSPILMDAQTVLDELAGQAATTQVRQPLAYLRKLVEQVKAGTFVAVAAPRVQAGRIRQEMIKAARRAQGADMGDQSSSPIMTDELRAKGRKHIEEINRKLFRRSIFSTAEISDKSRE